MQVVAATALSTTRIEVEYDTAYVSDGVQTISYWSIVADSPGLVPSIHTVTEATSTTVYLDVHPGLSAGSQYTVDNPYVKDSLNNFASPSSAQFTVSTSLYEEIEGYPLGVLEALTLAFGEQCQEVYQAPVTTLARDFESGDTTMFLDSCLGFPDRGAVFMKGVRYTYLSRTDGALVDVASDDLVLVTSAAGLEVAVDARSVEPR